jgi:hypothetical protein
MMKERSWLTTLDGSASMVGAGTYLGTGILAAIITICTLGICYRTT